MVRNIPVGYGPRAVLPDFDSKYLFTSEEASNSIGVIDRQMFEEN